MVRHGIDLDSEAIRAFCRRWRIRRLCVFGSILRDDFRADSDVDFLVDWDEGAEWDISDHMEAEEELARLVGRKVDLVGRAAVEASRNRFYIREILGTAEPIGAEG